jgi:hypothetical protein
MDAEKICKNVKPNIRPQAETLARAVLTLQKKIEDEIDGYQEMPLAQVLTTTQGEKALKANPAVQEFRATVRDYATALNNLNAILNKDAIADSEVSSLDSIRNKFKVAK